MNQISPAQSSASILALDLGTKCGFCVGTDNSHIAGHWNLKGGRFEGGGMRFLKFKIKLDEVHTAYPISSVYFEEVRRHRGVDAAHIYGGLLGTLTAWCEERGIPYEGLPVGEIKKNFTGSGNASKDMMVRECELRGYAPETDDEADAIAIFDLGLKRLKGE